jgi:type II secretory pathway component PulK
MRQKNSQKPLACLLADNSRASILIISLWSILFLSSFAVILGYQVRQKITLVKRLDDRDRLRLIAEGFVNKTVLTLSDQLSKEKEYDCLKDYWSSNEIEFRDFPIGGGFCTSSYNYVNENTQTTEIRYGLIDEERKININTAPMSTLKRLFNIVLDIDNMESQNLAASIKDWRDEDSQLSIPIGSAEDSYYRNLPYPYLAKDSLIEVLEEVLLVKGMTNEIFERIKPYITIYGQGRVNINTAPREVLLALGLDNNIVTSILFFRKGADGLEATPDDEFFEKPSNIVPLLSRVYNLSPSQLASVSQISQQYLTTQSSYFTIECSAYFNKGRYKMTVFCVFNRQGEILYWRER